MRAVGLEKVDGDADKNHYADDRGIDRLPEKAQPELRQSGG
ncbi:MAG TPA: hypothetical protein VFF39_09485 [Verrucomicrobiae bacterium]|nr:hypothetical protein [Verrucomicrobiae bacterium]